MDVGCIWLTDETLDKIEAIDDQILFAALYDIPTLSGRADDGRVCFLMWGYRWAPDFIKIVQDAKLDPDEYRCVIASGGRETARLGSMPVRAEDFEVLRDLVENGPKIHEERLKGWEMSIKNFVTKCDGPFTFGEDGDALVKAAATMVEPESPKP